MSKLVLVLASTIFEILMIASIPMYIKIYVYDVEGLLSRDMLTHSVAAKEDFFDALSINFIVLQGHQTFQYLG